MSLQVMEWIGRLSASLFVLFVLYFLVRLLFPQLRLWRTTIDQSIVRNIGNVDTGNKV